VGPAVEPTIMMMMMMMMMSLLKSPLSKGLIELVASFLWWYARTAGSLIVRGDLDG
jgi:hypothetical protein